MLITIQISHFFQSDRTGTVYLLLKKCMILGTKMRSSVRIHPLQKQPHSATYMKKSSSFTPKSQSTIMPQAILKDNSCPFSIFNIDTV